MYLLLLLLKLRLTRTIIGTRESHSLIQCLLQLLLLLLEHFQLGISHFLPLSLQDCSQRQKQ